MSQLILASEALSSGALTRRELQRSYRKVHHNVYAPREMELTAHDHAIAAWLWSDRIATVSGLSAAALLGSKWIPSNALAELVRTQYPAPPPIVVHQDKIADDEILDCVGVSCTTIARTGFDLGRRLPCDEGLIRVEALLNATCTSVSDVWAIAVKHPGARHIRRFREVIAVADAGAESPQETRVRLILLRGGLPRPATQIKVGWRRIDMGWPEWKVGVEYDGQQHWNDPLQHGGDIERLELFQDLGWRIVRVVADHLRSPQAIVDRAERAMRSAGWDAPLIPAPRIGLWTPSTGKIR